MQANRQTDRQRQAGTDNDRINTPITSAVELCNALQYNTIQYNINLYSATVAEKPLVRSSVVLIMCKQICF